MSAPEVDRDLIESVLRARGVLNERDVVFVGGSCADRLATPESDVDVFIIRRDDEHVDAALRLIPMPHDELTMDLEVWPMKDVETVLRRLAGAGAASVEDHRAFMQLSDDDRDFLHSLSIGIPVHNASGLRELQAAVDPGLLTTLSVARALVGITNSQTDLLGWLAAGDWQSAGHACQRLVEFAASALLAAAGSTHPGGKWVLALLRREYDHADVAPRLLCGAASLADRYYQLQVRPADRAGVGAYARACVTFANLSVVHVQTAGLDGAHDALHRVLRSPVGADAAGTDSPALSPAAQIRFENDGWYLISVGSSMYELNEVAACMLLLLDGHTPERDVVAALTAGSAPADPGTLASSLRDVLLFLENANLRAA